MFKKIIFSLLVAASFAAQGMDNRRNNDEKSLFESLKDVQNAQDRKSGYQAFDTFLQVNTPDKETKEFGESSLFVIHPKQELRQHNVYNLQKSKL